MEAHPDSAVSPRPRSRSTLLLVIGLLVVSLLAAAAVLVYAWSVNMDLVAALRGANDIRIVLTTDSLEGVQARHDAFERLERSGPETVALVVWSVRHVPAEHDRRRELVGSLVWNRDPGVQKAANSLLNDPALGVLVAWHYLYRWGDTRGHGVLLEHARDSGPIGDPARSGLTLLEHPEGRWMGGESGDSH